MNKFTKLVGDVLTRTAYAIGYDGAISTRKRQDLPSNRKTSQAEDMYIGCTDRNILRQTCMDMRRNNPYVAGLAKRISDNVVGSVIAPQAKTKDEKWNDEAEAFWKEWSKIVDIRGRCNMQEMQKLAIQNAWLLQGDMGFIFTDGGQLQPIEADRIATPKKLEGKMPKGVGIIDGVKINNATGQTLGYYIYNRNGQGKVDTGTDDYTFIDRENMIFLADPFRFDQVRGIPAISPVINSLKDVGELHEAILGKAKLDANKGWIVTSNDEMPGNMVRGVDNGVGVAQGERIDGIEMHYMRPGEDMKSLASNTPNSTYDSFLEKNLRIIGAALSLPYEFFVLDFSKGSYSSSRAALLQTYRTFTGLQEWLSSKMLQRMWNWRIAKAIKQGTIAPAPLDDKGVSQWYKVDWQYPEFGWVDPQNEAEANKTEYQMGVTTISSITRKKGRDAVDVLREKAGDIANAQKIADETNKSAGTNITWQDLINVETVANQKAKDSSSEKSDMSKKPDNTEDEDES